MRIAMFSKSYHPYVSGVVRSIDTFSMTMRKQGHQVHLFVPGPGQGYAGEQPTEDRFYFPSLALPGQVAYRQRLGSAGKEAVRSMSATVTADKMIRAYRGLVR